jgi:NTP pyrophosphatase (non-canonical NTP hydrolase)
MVTSSRLTWLVLEVMEVAEAVIPERDVRNL